ncbi:unnamed protein product [Blepharisma stoltei]|uniref:Uncharacterized protein n=1 Tax=Blepharisma stoltei TaxID=1481888 RepID=A0AAU9JU73_9CILI|nr:unnamed protein product [Blepharisma stoltei]
MDLLNSQIIKINQDLSKINEAQKILKELRENRPEILNRGNDPDLEQDVRRILSGSDEEEETKIDDRPGLAITQPIPDEKKKWFYS